MDILVFVIFGALAGWIADMVMKTNHSVLEDVVLGIVGAFIGGYLMNVLGQPGVTGFDIYSILVAVIGASVVIFIGRLLHR